MTNSNDMIEHQESCDYCVHLWEKVQQEEITQDQYERLSYECFTASQGE